MIKYNADYVQHSVLNVWIQNVLVNVNVVIHPIVIIFPCIIQQELNIAQNVRIIWSTANVWRSWEILIRPGLRFVIWKSGNELPSSRFVFNWRKWPLRSIRRHISSTKYVLPTCWCRMKQFSCVSKMKRNIEAYVLPCLIEESALVFSVRLRNHGHFPLTFESLQPILSARWRSPFFLKLPEAWGLFGRSLYRNQDWKSWSPFLPCKVLSMGHVFQQREYTVVKYFDH